MNKYIKLFHNIQSKYLCTLQRHVWTTWIKHCLATINCDVYTMLWTCEKVRVSKSIMNIVVTVIQKSGMYWTSVNPSQLLKTLWAEENSHGKLTDSLSSKWVVLLSPENGRKCHCFWPSCLFKHICQSLPQDGYSSLKKSFQVRKSFGWLRSNCSPFPFLPFKSWKSVKIWAEFLKPVGV